jgi:hypothetical protein
MTRAIEVNPHCPSDPVADEWEFSSEWDKDQEVEEWTKCGHFSCPGLTRRSKVDIVVKNRDCASSLSSLCKRFDSSIKTAGPFQRHSTQRRGPFGKYLNDERQNEDFFQVESQSSCSDSGRRRSNGSLSMPRVQRIPDAVSSQLYEEQTRPLGFWKQPTEGWDFSGSSSCPSLNYHHRPSSQSSPAKITEPINLGSNRAGPLVHKNRKDSTMDDRSSKVTSLAFKSHEPLTTGPADFAKWWTDEEHSLSEETALSTVVCTPPSNERKSVASPLLLASEHADRENRLFAPFPAEWQPDFQLKPVGTSQPAEGSGSVNVAYFHAKLRSPSGKDVISSSTTLHAPHSMSKMTPTSDSKISTYSSKRGSILSRWKHLDGNSANKVPPAFAALAKSSPKSRVPFVGIMKDKGEALPLLKITPDGFPLRGPSCDAAFSPKVSNLRQSIQDQHQSRLFGNAGKVPAWILLQQRKGNDRFSNRRISSGESVDSVTSTVTQWTKATNDEAVSFASCQSVSPNCHGERKRPALAARDTKKGPSLSSSFFRHRLTSCDNMEEATHLTWTRQKTDNFTDWQILVKEIVDNDKDEPNCPLVVKTETYYVHRSILGAGSRRSSYFWNDFTQNNQRTEPTTLVELTSSAADVFPDTLDYIYGLHEGHLKISTGTATALRFLGDHFGVSTMFQAANDFIQQDISTSNLHLYLKDAQTHGDAQLMEETIVFAARAWQGLIGVDDGETEREFSPFMNLLSPSQQCDLYKRALKEAQLDLTVHR